MQIYAYSSNTMQKYAYSSNTHSRICLFYYDKTLSWCWLICTDVVKGHSKLKHNKYCLKRVSKRTSHICYLIYFSTLLTVKDSPVGTRVECKNMPTCLPASLKYVCPTVTFSWWWFIHTNFVTGHSKQAEAGVMPSSSLVKCHREVEVKFLWPHLTEKRGIDEKNKQGHR